MALSRDERISILNVRLGLNDDEFRERLENLNQRQLGVIIKQLGLLEQVARDTGHNINTYIGQGFDAAANTAQARIREINNRLQRDIHGTINLSAIGTDAIVDKAYSSMSREHIRYTSGGLANVNAVTDNRGRAINYQDLNIDTGNYNQYLSRYAERVVDEIANAVRNGLTPDNIRRIYGNEASNLIGGGWTGTSDESRLQMAMAMANVSTMYDNVDFFGNANDPTQKASMVDQLGRKAIGTIQDANNTLNQFYEKLGSLVERQRLNFNKIGELESIDSILNIGGGKKAHMRFTAREMQSIAGLGTPEEILSWVRNNSQYITETHSDNEMAQQEQYKKLLIQEYDLELKINQAEREGNEQQVIELNRQRELVRLKQQELNDYRATQIDGDGRTREALTRTHGDISNTDSIAYLNERLRLRNQEINATNAQAHAEQQALSQTTQREQELIRLLNEENNAQQRLSTLKEGSDERIRLQNRIELIRQEQQAYSDLARYTEIVNQTRTSNFSRQGEEEVVNRLMTLENQRQEAWVKSYTLRQKGNNDESQQYQNIARNMGTLYQTELQLARTNNILSQSSIDALDAQRRSSQQEQEIIKSRQRDLEIQRQQNDTYKSLTSDLNKYLNLLKEKSKLEATKDYKSSGVFGNAYANVNSQIQTLTQSFGNLISVQNDGKLSIASWADTLGITREQYDKLALSVQDTNQKITDNQIKVKQEQDLKTIDKMVLAYTKLRNAKSQLQQAKDRNYNDATIRANARVVQDLENQYNNLIRLNPELAKTETFKRLVAEAESKMAISMSHSNQNVSQQMTLLQRLRSNLQRTAATAFNFNIFNRIFMELRQGISNVVETTKEFDKAMTDIQMVTNATDSSVKNLLASYSELAKELGVTTKIVSDGSIEWLRQGKTAEETTELLKASTMMSTLGAMESSEATQKLTAVLNAYKLEAQDAIGVVDKLVNADLIAATSTEELATAFQYSASFANVAGVSIDKMIGLLTTASETTRLSGETVGQAFKSIFSRIQNVRAGKDIDDEGESINDSEKVLARYNITLRESATEFRNVEDILDDVGKRWKEFDTVEKAQIATAISGVHQRNTFMAVMENYDKVLKYTNETMEASGTSTQKYEHYLDSLQSKINELQVQWEQYIQGLEASGVFEVVINVLSSLLSVLDALTVKTPILQTVLGTFLAFKAIKGLSSIVLNLGKSFKSLTSFISKPAIGLKQVFTELKGTSKMLNTITLQNGQSLGLYEKQQIATIISSKSLNMEQKEQQLTAMGLNAAQTQLILRTDEQTRANIQNIISNATLTEGQKKYKIALALLNTAKATGIVLDKKQAISMAESIAKQKTMTYTTQGLTAATSTLNIVLAAVSLAVSIGVGIWNSYQQSQEEAREAAVEAANEYQETKKSIEEVTEEYKKLKEELASTTDFSKQMEIKEDILALRDTIIDTYGVEASQIDLVNGKLEEQLNILERISKENANDYWNENTNQIREAVKYMNEEKEYSLGAVFGVSGVGVDRTISTDLEALMIERGINMNTHGMHHLNIKLEGTVEERLSQIKNYTKIINEMLDELELEDSYVDALDEALKALSAEKNTITNSDEYKAATSILPAAQQSFFAKEDMFKSETTGEWVDPSTIVDDINNIISDISNIDVSNVKEADKLALLDEQMALMEEQMTERIGYIKEMIDSTNDETTKMLLGDVGSELVLDYLKALNQSKAKIKISEAVENSGIKEKLSKTWAEELNISKDTDFTNLFTQIQESLKAEGVSISVEEIIDMLDLLGYTYQKTEKRTAGDLISNFANNEDQLNSTIETIEKLNAVINQISLGEAIDLSQIQELRQAGIDITQLINGSISDIEILNKIKQNYLNYQISLIDAEIEENKKQLEEDINITEEEIKQINLENQLNEIRKEQLKQAAKEIKANANEYIESLKSANELQRQLVNFGVSKIDNETLNAMSEQYEGMASYVEKYRLGLIDNEELLSQFEKFYNEELKNYKEYQRDKYSETNEFYDKWLSDNEDWVKDFKNKYGIDLTEFENYNEAKLAIEEEYTKKRADLNKLFGEDYSEVIEGGYVNLGTGELTDAGKEATSTGIGSEVEAKLAQKIRNFQKEYKEVFPKIKEVETNAENAKNALDNMFDSKSDYTLIDDTELVNSDIESFTERITNAKSLIQDLEESSGKITFDVLNEMKDAYPAMTEYTNKYLQGLIDENDLIAEFKKIYNKDYDAFVLYLGMKEAENRKISDDFIDNNEKWLKELGDGYTKDLKAATTYAEAKNIILEGITDTFGEKSSFNPYDYFDENYNFNEKWNEYVNNVVRTTGNVANVAGYEIMHVLQNLLKELYGIVDENSSNIEDRVDNLLNNTKNTVEDFMSDISSYLSNQKDIYDQLADGIVSAAQLEIDALDREIELIEKKNEEQQRQIELQEKLEALNRAKTQRNVREYNAETGEFEWVANRKDIETAQREYDEALKEEEIRKLEDRKAELEAYQDSFSNIEEIINNQRASDMAKKYIADLYYSGDTSKVDLLKLTDKQQSEFRTAYANAISQSLDFEQMQSNKDNNGLMNKIAGAGFGTKNGETLNLNFDAIANALGVPLINTTGNYEDILKQTSFAETKPTTSTINNITNTGAVTTSYVFSGDMTFKFDGDIDVDRFITELSTKLDEKTAITPIH